MQALTFQKMAPMGNGRVDMRYRRVECHPPSDLSVIVDQNRGAGGWIRLQVKVGAPLVSVLGCPGWRGAVQILSTVPTVDWVLLGVNKG